MNILTWMIYLVQVVAFREKKLKKNDIILVLVLGIVLGSLYFFTNGFSFANKNSYEIHIRDTSGNISVKTFNDEGTFVVPTDNDNFNEYEIKDGYVNMIHSNCKDKLCVNMKKISKNGEMIVCLPHKVYISVHSLNEEDDGDGIDAVAE